MKTKEELSEDVGLVRDVEAWCGTARADDIERGFVDALCRKAYEELPKLQIPHVRRINEAVCKMEFPSPTALGLRRRCLEVLSAHHNLRQYRNVKMPLIQPPAPAGKS
jgi:hypothetical protein